MKTPKEEYKYTMGIYLMTVELPAKDSWCNKDALFAFEALTVPYKKASGKLHLKTWSNDYRLPYGLAKLYEGRAFDDEFPDVIDCTNGCIPPSRRRHWYLCYPALTEENEARARQKFSKSLANFRDSEYRSEVSSNIRKYRLDSRFLDDSSKLLMEGFSGKRAVVPHYNKTAFLYWLGSRSEPVFEWCEYEYLVERSGRVVSQQSFDHDQRIRESDFGKVYGKYPYGTVYVILKEKDDSLALSLLKDQYAERVEWAEKSLAEMKQVLAAADTFKEAKLR